MDTFRVALTGDFKTSKGRPSFPDFDLSPLDQNPLVDYAFIPANGLVRAKDLEGFDALILLMPRIESVSFPDDGRLAMIARFGVGYDNVDVRACSDNGCALVITPDGVRRPVAVSVLTFMLALSGRLMVKDRLTREGPKGWAKRNGHMGQGLVGHTLGSLGIGNIGAEVFRLAKPLDMSFIAHDPYASPKIARELGIRLVGLEELFLEADVLSISCPLTPETHHLVNGERLALMKRTAFLINTARGGVVDQRALAKALERGRLAGAALDVFEDEPLEADDPLQQLDNVILTPHSICWTDQCFAGNGAADIKAVLDVMHGRPPTGVVNRDVLEQTGWRAKLQKNRERFSG